MGAGGSLGAPSVSQLRSAGKKRTLPRRLGPPLGRFAVIAVKFIEHQLTVDQRPGEPSRPASVTFFVVAFGR